MKYLSKAVLATYLLVLLWLVLFKLSADVFSVLLDYQTRSLNLIPFAGISQYSIRDMVYNVLAFVPFGLLLSVNFKRATLWRKLIFISIFSLTVETIQFLLAIGTSDITDVVMNTLGGFAGLLLYGLSSKYVDNDKLSRVIVVAIAVLLTLFMLLRVLFFHVRYQ